MPPRWHSDGVWSALVGGPGGYSVTPTDARFVWGGYYEQRSLIWRSRWVTTTGIIECREALAFPGDPHTAVVLRRVVAVDGDAEVRVRLAVRAGFGAHLMTVQGRRDDGFTATSGPIRIRWHAGWRFAFAADGSRRGRDHDPGRLEPRSDPRTRRPAAAGVPALPPTTRGMPPNPPGTKRYPRSTALWPIATSATPMRCCGV